MMTKNKNYYIMGNKKKKKEDYIKFKVTASKDLKCDKCGKNLYGKAGFVEIKLGKGKYDSIFTPEVKIKKVCLSCFEEMVGKVELERMKGGKRFNKLLKINILRNLDDKNKK